MNIGLEQLCIIAKNSFEWSKLEIYLGGGGGGEGRGKWRRESRIDESHDFFHCFPPAFWKTDGFESNQLAEYKSMFCAMRLIKIAVKFFPTTDKSLVIACVLNDKVSKTVYS